MYAPALAPAAEIDALNRGVNKVLALPEVRARFTQLGLDVGGGSPADLQRTMREDTLRWGPIVKKSGFRAS
jgi:tripartite-type tricarboxylate transporter receptor subunit TctC